MTRILFCFARRAATVALTCCALATEGRAEPTTTDEVGDVADFLFKDARCRDFSAALAKTKSGNQTTTEILITILGVVYMEGYAAGAGNSSSHRADLIVRCTLHPNDHFNTVKPGS